MAVGASEILLRPADRLGPGASRDRAKRATPSARYTSARAPGENTRVDESQMHSTAVGEEGAGGGGRGERGDGRDGGVAALPKGLNHTHLSYHVALLRARGGLDVTTTSGASSPPPSPPPPPPVPVIASSCR